MNKYSITLLFLFLLPVIEAGASPKKTERKVLRPYPSIESVETTVDTTFKIASYTDSSASKPSPAPYAQHDWNTSFGPTVKGSPAQSKIYDLLIPAVPLMIGGLCVKGDGFRNLRNDFIPQFHNATDDYLQYAPAAAMLIIKACGVKSRSSWGRMLVSDAFSVAIMATAVNAIKYTVKDERPDGSAKNSFPSGHTATAFMCAAMLSKEFSGVSPWIGVGGYAIATATGLMRIANNRHWFNDILVGAGIGIISTELGYLFADLIFKNKGLKLKAPLLKADRWRKPSFLGVNFALSVPLNTHYGHFSCLKIIPGSTASLEGAGFINPFWGVGGQISVSSFSMRYDTRTEVQRLERIHAYGGVYGSYPLAPYVLVGGRLMMGFNYYPSATFSDIVFESSKGFAVATGVNVTLLLRKKFGLRFYADYELSHSAFSSKKEMNSIIQYFNCGASASIAF